MKNFITVNICTAVLFSALIKAQPSQCSLIWMNIRDNAFIQDSTTVMFGNHPNATYGLDSLYPNLQEYEAPPGIAPGFDVRWVGLPYKPRSPNAFLDLDIRGIPQNFNKADTFRLRISDLEAPRAKWTFKWPQASFLQQRCDSIFLSDPLNHFPIVNMMLQDSLIIYGPDSLGINYLMIYKYGVTLPDSITEISGTIFNDKNCNGVRDSVGLQGEENGLSNWQVNLSGPENRTTITDSNGRYSFYNLTNGTYTISEVVKSGWGQTSPVPVPPGTYSVTISPSSKYNPGKDFGNVFMCINGTVYEDRNGNTMRDNIGYPNEEQALIGWQINLNGPINRTTITDSSGQYIFTDLIPGTYTITEEKQTGWNQTYPILPDVHSVVIGPATGYNFIRDFGNQRVELIQGMKYHDINGNGIKDIGDTALPGWKIIIKDIKSTWTDSTVTDETGNYIFKGLHVGEYIVKEVQQPTWIRTNPLFPKFYTAKVGLLDSIFGKNFGNKRAKVFTGDPNGGNWSVDSNWENNVIPDSNDFVFIPSNFNINIDTLPKNKIGGLVLDQNSNLIFSTSAGFLILKEFIEINSGSSIQFPENTENTGLICFGDFINSGTIISGQSMITFASEDTQTIVDAGVTESEYLRFTNNKYWNSISSELNISNNKNSNDNNAQFDFSENRNEFYKLKISGEKVNSIGNIIIQNQLILQKSLELRDQDTVVIKNNNINAIDDTGKILRGTIIRSIAENETGEYRFESPQTFVKFTGRGTNPDEVSMTVLLEKPSGDLYWDSLGGQNDPIKNTIVIDSTKKFSKWPFGIPRPRIIHKLADSLFYKINPINRVYVIRQKNGKNYCAQLSLRYDSKDFSTFNQTMNGLSPISITESDIKLFRGPLVSDSVQAKWNIVSLPVSLDSTNKDDLFPTSISDAFTYEDRYVKRNELRTGEGYWIKFLKAEEIIIDGIDMDSIAIDVHEGWNLIGAISFPVDVNTIITIPPGIITSMFFGYNNGYQTVDSLKTLKGYWVKTSACGKLIMKAYFKEMESNFIGLFDKNELESMNTLKICDAMNNNMKLYFGNHMVDLCRYELPPIPPEGIFDVRFKSGRFVEIFDKKEKEIPIQILFAEYPITIQWEIVDEIQNASLIIDGKETKLSKTGSVEVKNLVSEIKLKLTAVSNEKLPIDFALYQNYPNPFNPTTTIKYQIPVASKVTLKIYNLLGQEVKTLVDENQEAGYKLVEWQVDNISSGVYFYRLTAESSGKSFVAIKKLLLMK